MTTNIIYNSSNYAQWIIDLIKPEVINSLNAVSYWREHKNHKCYACGRYGHINRDCKRICPLCENLHDSPICLPSLLTEITKITKAVSKITRQEELLGVYKNSLERINKRIDRSIKKAMGSPNLEVSSEISLFYEKTAVKQGNVMILTQSQTTALSLRASTSKSIFSFFKKAPVFNTRSTGIDYMSKPPETYSQQLPIYISYQGSLQKYDYVPTYLEKSVVGYRFKYRKEPVLVQWKIHKYRNAAVSVRHAEFGVQKFLQHQAKKEKLKMKIKAIEQQFKARFNHVKNIEVYMKDTKRVVKKREEAENKLRQAERKYQRVKDESTRMNQQMNRRQAKLDKINEKTTRDLNNHINLSIQEAKKLKKKSQIESLSAALKRTKDKLKDAEERGFKIIEVNGEKEMVTNEDVVKGLREKVKKLEAKLKVINNSW